MKNIDIHRNLYKGANYNALAPVIGYEPWPIRTIYSVKDSINRGVPVLIRLHSGSRYPCKELYKLDMESHAVLIVGYDDTEQMFTIVDPWDSKNGGSRSGIIKLPYLITMGIECVNGTYDKAMRLSEPEVHIDIKEKKDKNNIELTFGFFVPKGYIIDKYTNKFTKLYVEVEYNYDNKNIKKEFVTEGDWCIGDYAVINIPLEDELKGQVEFKFKLLATLQGERPYNYKEDIIGKIEKTFFIESVNDSILEDYIDIKNAL